jgi:uncharacterized membrane protein
MFLGYDAPRLHAALNDLPPALLPLSVLFDLLGIFFKRDSLKAAAFWTLVFGVLGTGAAIVAGLFAEDAVAHSDQAHAIMETHKTLAFIVLGIFGVLAIWRIMRRDPALRLCAWRKTGVRPRPGHPDRAASGDRDRASRGPPPRRRG